MNIFGIFKSKKSPTANLAKERLKIIVEHSRTDAKRPVFLNKMRQEILAVVNKYIDIDIDAINTIINNNGDSEVLELNIILPDTIDVEKAQAKLEKQELMRNSIDSAEDNFVSNAPKNSQNNDINIGADRSFSDKRNPKMKGELELIKPISNTEAKQALGQPHMPRKRKKQV